MYVVVRRYTGASALADVMVQREQEVRELISTVPGFRAYYAARTGGGDAVATVTVCDDKAGTDESMVLIVSERAPRRPPPASEYQPG